MATSKEQQKLTNAIKQFVSGKIIENYRPDLLKNEKTGLNYEVDIYLQQLGVCVEYQGMIHFKRVGRYRNDSDKSRYNDMAKFDLCGKFRKLPMVEIFPTDLIGDIKSNFIKRLLITQEVYFNNIEFKKCRQLERLYLSITYGSSKGSTSNFFDSCDSIKNYKRYGNSRNNYISNLIQISKMVADVRPIFNIHRVAKLLHFDIHLDKINGTTNNKLRNKE